MRFSLSQSSLSPPGVHALHLQMGHQMPREKESHNEVEMLGNEEFKGIFIIIDWEAEGGGVYKTCRVETEIYESTFPVIAPVVGLRREYHRSWFQHNKVGLGRVAKAIIRRAGNLDVVPSSGEGIQ
jgi:hypothetical protein